MMGSWNRLGLGLMLCTAVLTAQTWGFSAPRRIVSTAPSVTEILFALGAEDELVGVTSFCDYPPEASRKTLIGDFASPNLEVILRLKPDLIILLDDRQDLVEKFRPFGLPLLIIRCVEVDEIMTSIEQIGDAIGRTEEASTLVGSLRRRLDTVRQRASARPKPKTLFLVGRNAGALTDLYGVGMGSFIGQLIEIAGGRNVLGRLQAPYPKISIEDVLAADPEVIIDLSLAGGSDPAETVRSKDLWNDFPTLSAVRNGRVYLVQDQSFLIPGPRIVQAAEVLAGLLDDHE